MSIMWGHGGEEDCFHGGLREGRSNERGPFCVAITGAGADMRGATPKSGAQSCEPSGAIKVMALHHIDVPVIILNQYVLLHFR